MISFASTESSALAHVECSRGICQNDDLCGPHGATNSKVS
jgi:hypothetical protein